MKQRNQQSLLVELREKERNGRLRAGEETDNSHEERMQKKKMKMKMKRKK